MVIRSLTWQGGTRGSTRTLILHGEKRLTFLQILDKEGGGEGHRERKRLFGGGGGGENFLEGVGGAGGGGGEGVVWVWCWVLWVSWSLSPASRYTRAEGRGGVCGGGWGGGGGVGGGGGWWSGGRGV